jgi:hypothetical protein
MPRFFRRQARSRSARVEATLIALVKRSKMQSYVRPSNAGIIG